MADTTNALPSASEPVVDRYRRWTPNWFRFIKPLLETVRATTREVATVSSSLNDVTTTVTEVAESVNGLEARWGVQIDVNGKVIGLVRLDGGATGSTFTVLADKFIIRRPTSTDEIQAFVVGLVNGVETVGINGNLVVDDTILARHLSVTSLSAITADMGTITAGQLNSTNGLTTFNLNTGRLTVVAPP